jgi:hypothetical protein
VRSVTAWRVIAGNQSPIFTWQEGGAVSHTSLTQDNPFLHTRD